MGAGLYTKNNGVLEWLDEHGQCHPHAFSPHLYDVPGFSLHCEGAMELDPAKQNAGPPRRDRRNGIRAENKDGVDTNVDLRPSPAVERRTK